MLDVFGRVELNLISVALSGYAVLICVSLQIRSPDAPKLSTLLLGLDLRANPLNPYGFTLQPTTHQLYSKTLNQTPKPLIL